MFIGVCVGSNGGNSFEMAGLLKADLEEIWENMDTKRKGVGYIGKTRNITELDREDSRKDSTITRYGSDQSIKNQEIAIEISDMDSIDIDMLHGGRVVIFVCSTTGDGDAPYNMQGFWREIKRKIFNEKFLFYFSVIGLGDSSYPKYNYAGKRLFNRLKQIGGIPICRRCDCDEMDPIGVYSEYSQWKEELRNGFIEKHDLFSRSRLSVFLDKKRKESAGVFLDKKRLSSEICVNFDFPNKEIDTDQTNAADSRLSSVYSEVFEYRFVIENAVGADYSYSPGDVLSITPENTQYKEDASKIFYDDLEYFCRHLDYNAVPMQHKIVELYSLVMEGKYAIINCPNSLNDFYMDRLDEICKSYDAYYSYILQPKKSFKEILTDFYIKISIKSKLIRKILPRYYTISKKEGNVYSITAGRIEILHYKKEIRGVCSEYLYGLPEGSSVSVDIKKTQLAIEGDLLLICSGTGISLGRTVLNEYLTGRIPQVTSLSIIFGFRSLSVDFLHCNEILQNKHTEIVHKNGYLSILNENKNFCIKLFICPSRIKKDTNFLDSHKIDSNAVREKNYLNGILEIVDRKELEKNVILCGSVRLLKTLPEIIRKATGLHVKPQSECW